MGDSGVRHRILDKYGKSTDEVVDPQELVFATRNPYVHPPLTSTGDVVLCRSRMGPHPLTLLHCFAD